MLVYKPAVRVLSLHFVGTGRTIDTETHFSKKIVTTVIIKACAGFFVLLGWAQKGHEPNHPKMAFNRRRLLCRETSRLLKLSMMF